MNQPTREDLLGYLLGSLDADEHQRVESYVKEDPEVDQDLHVLKCQLQPLSVLESEPAVPPAGLARRTCESIALRDPVHRRRPASASLSHAAPGQLRFSRGSSIGDLVLGAVCCAILAAIILPSIASARFESRVLACQNRLREIGFAMLNFSEIADGDFVPIRNSGNLNVAGAYAPTLLDAGLIEDKSAFYCPGVYQEPRTGGIPTLEEIAWASGSDLQRMQSRMGGDYGYSLGYLEGRTYRPPRVGSDGYNVIMADQPSHDLAGRSSRNHGGRGQNVLCGDLQVKFISSCTLTPDGDPIYLNRHGLVAAGVNADDIVIGRGTDSPFMQPYSFESQ